MSHAEATDNVLAKAVLIDIANEERVHVGELIRLLGILTKGKEDEFLLKGKSEVDATAAGLVIPSSVAMAPKEEPTIGSLKTNGV